MYGYGVPPSPLSPAVRARRAHVHKLPTLSARQADRVDHAFLDSVTCCAFRVRPMFIPADRDLLMHFGRCIATSQGNMTARTPLGSPDTIVFRRGADRYFLQVQLRFPFPGLSSRSKRLLELESDRGFAVGARPVNSLVSP